MREYPTIPAARARARRTTTVSASAGVAGFATGAGLFTAGARFTASTVAAASFFTVLTTTAASFLTLVVFLLADRLRALASFDAALAAFATPFSAVAMSFFSSDFVVFLLPEIFFATRFFFDAIFWEIGFFFESFCATRAPRAGRGAFRASDLLSRIPARECRVSFRGSREWLA